MIFALLHVSKIKILFMKNQYGVPDIVQYYSKGE